MQQVKSLGGVATGADLNTATLNYLRMLAGSQTRIYAQGNQAFFAQASGIKHSPMDGGSDLRVYGAKAVQRNASKLTATASAGNRDTQPTYAEACQCGTVSVASSTHLLMHCTACGSVLPETNDGEFAITTHEDVAMARSIINLDDATSTASRVSSLPKTNPQRGNRFPKFDSMFGGGSSEAGCRSEAGAEEDGALIVAGGRTAVSLDDLLADDDAAQAGAFGVLADPDVADMDDFNVENDEDEEDDEDDEDGDMDDADNADVYGVFDDMSGEAEAGSLHIIHECDDNDYVPVDLVEGFNPGFQLAEASFKYVPSTEVFDSEWYMTYQGVPIAVASHRDVPAGLRGMFGAASFRNATCEAIASAGLKDGLTAMGFKSLRVAVPIAPRIQTAVANAVASSDAKLAASKHEFDADFSDAVATAAVALNKGIFAKRDNPLKAAMVRRATAAGLDPQVAAESVDGAFMEAGTDFAETLVAEASRIKSLPDAARREQTQAILDARYQRTHVTASSAVASAMSKPQTHSPEAAATASAQATLAAIASQQPRASSDSFSTSAVGQVGVADSFLAAIASGVRSL